MTTKLSCRACGWNLPTPRTYYCAPCDPKGLRESNAYVGEYMAGRPDAPYEKVWSMGRAQSMARQAPLIEAQTAKLARDIEHTFFEAEPDLTWPEYVARIDSHWTSYADSLR